MGYARYPRHPPGTAPSRNHGHRGGLLTPRMGTYGARRTRGLLPRRPALCPYGSGCREALERRAGIWAGSAGGELLLAPRALADASSHTPPTNFREHLVQAVG